jgi:hypothetical protein
MQAWLGPRSFVGPNGGLTPTTRRMALGLQQTKRNKLCQAERHRAAGVQIDEREACLEAAERGGERQTSICKPTLKKAKTKRHKL